MKAYPIIQARTLNSGFPSNLLFCPECLNAEELSTSKKYILSAVNSFDAQKGIRRIVFRTGNYIVFGIATFIDELGKLTETAEAELYSKDKFGRRLYGFIGYCANAEVIVKNHEIPDISDKDMMNLYLKCISSENVWKCSELISHKTCQCEIKSKAAEAFETCENIVTNCSDEKSRQIYESFIYECACSANISLCTNLQNEYIMHDSKFTFMTTPLQTVSIPIIKYQQIEKSGGKHSYKWALIAAAAIGAMALGGFIIKGFH